LGFRFLVLRFLVFGLGFWFSVWVFGFGLGSWFLCSSLSNTVQTKNRNSKPKPKTSKQKTKNRLPDTSIEVQVQHRHAAGADGDVFGLRSRRHDGRVGVRDDGVASRGQADFIMALRIGPETRHDRTDFQNREAAAEGSVAGLIR
jgi:hypothetical protein